MDRKKNLNTILAHYSTDIFISKPVKPIDLKEP